MLPPIRRTQSGGGSFVLSRLSSLASSSSPLLLCVGLIGLLFLLVTVASQLPTFLSSHVTGAGLTSGDGQGGRRDAAVSIVPTPSPARPPSASPGGAILQWEKTKAGSSPDSPSDALSPVAPAGGAPLHSPSPAPAAAAAPQAKPKPPVVVAPHHQVDGPSEGGKGQGGGGGGGGGEGEWGGRAEAIKAAFLHAYSHYENKCFGQDEYRPVHPQATPPLPSPVVPHPPRATDVPSAVFSPLPSVVRSVLQLDWCGSHYHRSARATDHPFAPPPLPTPLPVLILFLLSPSDALPTMAVMGLTAEHGRAVEWVTGQLRLDQNMMTSFFETTIRVLGGLVSAYDLGGGKNAKLLEKAETAGRPSAAGVQHSHGAASRAGQSGPLGRRPPCRGPVAPPCWPSWARVRWSSSASVSACRTTPTR